MADFSAVSGIGNALSQGVDTYMKAMELRQAREDREAMKKLRQDEMDFQIASKGYEKDPETGKYNKTAAQQNREKLENVGGLLGKAGDDAPYMPAYGKYAQGLLGGQMPEFSPQDFQYPAGFMDRKARASRAGSAQDEKLTGEAKKALGFVVTGLNSAQKYADAYSAGGRQEYIDSSTPILGRFMADTPITEARTEMEESIGRLASGGAINSEEEARFRRMLPRAADDQETAIRKLMSLREQMLIKAKAYGADEGRLRQMGFDVGGRGLLSGKKPPGGGAPAVGFEEEGYRFLGGDPANPASWQKVQ